MGKAWNYGAGPSMIPVEVMEKAQKEFLDFNGLGLGIVEPPIRTNGLGSFTPSFAKREPSPPAMIAYLMCLKVSFYIRQN